jgi:hypothetical protein
VMVYGRNLREILVWQSFVRVGSVHQMIAYLDRHALVRVANQVGRAKFPSVVKVILLPLFMRLASLAANLGSVFDECVEMLMFVWLLKIDANAHRDMIII